MKKLTLLIITAVIFSMLSIITFNTAAKDTLRGVWVGTVKNLDFPSKTGLDEASLKKEIDKIINSCKDNDINTVFFQVRPNSDALYKSKIFPWSEVISGKQGTSPDNNFDPLSYIIQKSHEKDIELHAWINPYRIGTGGEAKVLGALSKTNPAVLHPEYRVSCSDGGVYYNPALPEVRSLIVDGVMEIIENYDVDGIHFDDYFYPYGVSDYPDSKDYEKYGKDFKTVADFRRNNVNLLVKSVYDAVHNYDDSLVFGISPFGIWDNKGSNPNGSETKGMSSYSEIYADSRKWVQNGWVDYICPQVYWSFENTAAPFDKVCDWWDALCKDSDVELYIGHALYKMGSDELGWKDANQLPRQFAYTEKLSSVDGNVIFRAGLLDMELEPQKTLETPPFESDYVKITGPVRNYKTTDPYASITGVANPSNKLFVNGKELSLTEHGYFSYYAKLSVGKNTFTFQNGSHNESITITRTKPVTADKTFNTCFEADSAYPFGDCKLYSGEALNLAVRALDGSEVSANLGGEQIPLEEGVKHDGFTEYTATVTLPNLYAGSFDMGELTFSAVYNGQTYTYNAAKITVIDRPMILYTLNECYVYDSIYGGSMMDNYQLPSGATVTATALVDDNYRLLSGKWINKQNVTSEKTDVQTSSGIDTSKYIKTELVFSSAPTFTARVTEGGKLAVEFFGGGAPTVTSEEGIDVSFIDRGLNKIAIFKADSAITGFYITATDNTLCVYVYRNTDSLAGKTIVIDVGHGGEDIGAAGPAGKDGACESALNLSASLILKRKLEQKGAKVVLTRDSDVTLPLADRAGNIRNENPDVSISVHHNSVARGSDFNKASGLLVLYSRETSLPLANAIERHIADGLPLQSKGARTQSLNVCRDYRYPCVLLECGYVCNPSEYELLLTDAYKNQLCDNIVAALSEYFG